MKQLPLIRPKKGEIQAREFDVGWCHHGYRLMAIVGEGIPVVAWHTGPSTRRGNTARGLTEDGRAIVPCLDDGGVLERDVLTWITK